MTNTSNPNTSDSPLLPSPETASQLSPNHVASLIPLKLTKDNYLLWKDILTLVLHNYGMFTLVDGSDPSPPPFIGTNVNPAYSTWLKKDRTCRIWIIASLSESILPYTVGSTTARSLWLNLERRFAALTRSHVLQLRRRIQTIQKGSLSIIAYLQQVKEVSDSLAAAGEPLTESDLVAHILHGLTPDYEAFTTSIRVRAEPVTADELHGLLLSQEIELEIQAAQHNVVQPLPPPQAFAVTPNRPRQPRGPNPIFRPNNRSRFPNHSSHPRPQAPNVNPPLLPNPPFRSLPSFNHNPNVAYPPHSAHQNRPRARCQICGLSNHQALDCYNRWNHAYQGRVPPARLAAMVAAPRRPQYPATSGAFNAPPYTTTMSNFNPNQFSDASTSADPTESLWYIDSGATNHITHDLSNLQMTNEYSGPDQVSVANGQGSSIGETSLSRPY